MRVCLCRLVRQEKLITIEVPDDFEPKLLDQHQETQLSFIYEADDGTGFIADEEWGVIEGTHYVVGPSTDKKSDICILD